MTRSIIARDDTLLGVCHAIGEDFGFNPLWLRIAFACVLFWSPIGAFAGYAALGAIVALSRWLAPAPELPEVEPRSEEEPVADLKLAA
jgi:phage shock protein PspC (stress-responsive transcriptional regulator)